MGPEVLSQSEIDALLKALTSGTIDVSSLTEEEKERAVKVYDFKRPDKFNKDQLRAIQMIHEFFCPSAYHCLFVFCQSHGVC